MKKNIILQTIFFSLAIFLVSCTNGLTDKKSKNKGDQQSYIVISLITDMSRMAQGNVFPNSRVNDLTNIVLTGKLGDTGAEQTLATESKIEDLTNNPIPLSPGSWTFTLTAKLSGIDFEATLTKVQVEEGTNTPVSFALEPVSSVTKGGLDITVKFPDAANRVYLAFQNLSSGSPNYFEYTADGALYKILTDENNKKYINYAKALSTDGSSTGLEPGTYKLWYTFYADPVPDILNTFIVYATVSKGFTTSETIELTSLNEIYNITYKTYKTESDKPAGITSQDDIDSLVAGGQTWTDKYTRKSTTVTLPTLTLAGYHFDGWYDESDNKLVSWSQRTGDLTLYAKWSSGSVGVDVTDPAEKVTLTRSATDSNGIITFTAATTTSATTYAWYVDGVKDDTATGSTFEFDKTGKAFGNYVITVECGGYSATEIVKLDPIGSKLTPNALYDIVFKDGSAEAYQEGMTLTDEQKASAVAIIFNIGADCSNDKTTPRILGVGLKNSNGDSTQDYTWAKEDSTGYTTKFEIIQITQSTTEPTGGTVYYQYDYNNSTYYLTGDFDGSDNWSEICAQDSTGTANAESIAENYPAFNYVNNYAVNTGLTGTYATGWYMPTIVELHCIYKNKTLLNTILSLFGDKADTLANNWYWSSSQFASYGNQAWVIDFSNGYVENNGNYKDINRRVCAVRAF